MGESLVHTVSFTVLSCNSGVYDNSVFFRKGFGLGLCCYSVRRSIKIQRCLISEKDVNFKGMRGGRMRNDVLDSVDSVIGGELYGEESSLASGEELPPWGNAEMGRGVIDLEVRKGVKVLKSANMMFRVDDDDGKVFFLEERDERVLSRRMLSLSRCNKVNSALGLFRSMKASGLLPGVHASNSLLSCLLRNGMHSDALCLFELMKTSKIATGHSYSLMLKAIAKIQGLDAAITMFWELERGSDTKKEFDTIVYNCVISACASVNNWIHAEKVWRNMKENGIAGNSITYCVLVCNFVRCGQNDMAIDAYDEMVQNGLEPSQDAMQAVVGACSKEGKWDMAHSVFQKMLDSKLKPSLITCNILINMLGKSGTFSQAYEVYEIMRSLGHEPDAYTWKALLGSLYQAKRFDDALQFFELIRNEDSPALNSHLYNTALMSCKKLRLWEKALQLLWQMEASELVVDVMSYNIVLNTCEVARKPKLALQVYEHMIQQNCLPDTFSYLSLIRACIWGSIWEKVDEILTLVPPSSSLYNAAIQGMFLRGKLHAARKLYREMLAYDLEPDGKTRVFILQTYKKLPERDSL